MGELERRSWSVILVLWKFLTVLIENADAGISSYFGSCCAYMAFIYFFSGEETGV
uniref:Uncharacterized protein n=1 Tax=Arundo donax TaxID=35708 RepID=A0A0A9FSF8_ARUDO